MLHMNLTRSSIDVAMYPCSRESDQRSEGGASDDVGLPQCPDTGSHKIDRVPTQGIPSRERAKGEKEGTLGTRDGSFSTSRDRRACSQGEGECQQTSGRSLFPTEPSKPRGSTRDQPIKNC